MVGTGSVAVADDPGRNYAPRPLAEYVHLDNYYSSSCTSYGQKLYVLVMGSPRIN